MNEEKEEEGKNEREIFSHYQIEWARSTKFIPSDAHTHIHTHTACNHRRSRGRHMQFRWICIKCISGFILIYHDFEWDAKRHPVGRLNILLFVSVQRSELKRCKVDLKLWIISNFSTKRIGVDDFVDACPPSPFSQFTHECFFFSQFRLFLWVHFPNHLEVTEGWGMHRIRKKLVVYSKELHSMCYFCNNESFSGLQQKVIVIHPSTNTHTYIQLTKQAASMKTTIRSGNDGRMMVKYCVDWKGCVTYFKNRSQTSTKTMMMMIHMHIGKWRQM